MDIDDTARKAAGLNAYGYSYTANGYQSAANASEMFSTWTGTTGSGWIPAKLGNVRNPANKLMLVEEPVANRDFPCPDIRPWPMMADGCAGHRNRRDCQFHHHPAWGAR